MIRTPGFVFYDDFNRASPGLCYSGGTTSIVAQRLRLTGALTYSCFSGGGFTGPMFGQATFIPSANNAELSLQLQINSNNYTAQLFGGNATLYQGFFSGIAGAPYSTVGGTPYSLQFFAKTGEQKLWVNQVFVVGATDVTNVASVGTFGLRCTGTADIDDIYIVKRRTVICSGMPPGSSVRVRNASNVVVLGPVVEVGGVATLDFGGVTFPASSIEVINASSVVLDSYTGQVIPGDDFVFEAPAPSGGGSVGGGGSPSSTIRLGRMVKPNTARWVD